MKTVTPTAICTIELEDDTVILTPNENLGEFQYERLVDDVNSVMQQLNENCVRNVVIDFHESDYFGSNAINLFLALRRITMQNGGQIAFFSVSDHEIAILKTMALDRLFPICASRQEALDTVRINHSSRY